LSAADRPDGALAALPAIPRTGDSPVFAEPWQAEVFALAVALQARGHFTWGQWAERLAAEIRSAQQAGDPDLGDTYYLHWLRALERLVVEKNVLRADDLSIRRDAWERAARATPHGEPIVLGRELRG
jgi:nitrile hydratase accessory protein